METPSEREGKKKKERKKEKKERKNKNQNAPNILTSEIPESSILGSLEGWECVKASLEGKADAIDGLLFLKLRLS